MLFRSQANFMRNLRMSMPQYVTNVTSFDDVVKILKNKSILTESHAGNDQYSERAFDVAQVLKDKYNMDAEGVYVYLVDDMNLDNGVAQAIVDKVFDEENELEDLISKYSEEESGKHTKFQDVPGAISEEVESFGGQSQDRGETGSTIQFKVTKNTPEYFEIDYVITPNSKSTPKTGYKHFQRTKEEGTEKIMKGDLRPDQKESIKVKGVRYYIGKRFAEKIYGGEKLEEGRKKKEVKAELHPNQINPHELRIGIKVELEHTDELDVAKKIALDHLKENPFYYTQLKLSGVDVKATPSKEKKAIAKKKIGRAHV